MEGSSQKDQLKRYFARRVTNQVRIILTLWRQLNDVAWSSEHFFDFRHAIQTLVRFAEHFNEEAHRRTGRQILQCLDLIDEDSLAPPADVLSELTETISELSQMALRRSDSQDYQPANAMAPKKPVYIALQDVEKAFRLAEQVEFFGFRPLVITSRAEFESEMQVRQPAAIVIDVELAKESGTTDSEYEHISGLEILARAQAHYETKVHSIVYSSSDANIFTRLIATRAGARYFHHGQLDIGRVVEQLETITQLLPPSPYTVLIVDDSRSQGLATQRTLNQGGLIAEVINDPLLILESIEAINPELILLDMYMPGVMGTELAQVIRQFEEYQHIPLVFLSSEDNKDKQVDAMVFGADDFINKSEEPKHLVAEIKARGRRARALTYLMHCDSLTGLLNHTQILRRLRQEVAKHLASQASLCFAMVDIDHFKSVNDTYGHPEGDRVIKRLAMFLKQRLRKTDFVGRYGGEEFAIVLPNTTLDDALVFMNDIREHYAKFRYHTVKGEFTSTMSGGLVQLDAGNADDLTVCADEALYEAKRSGRNQVCKAPPSESTA